MVLRAYARSCPNPNGIFSKCSLVLLCDLRNLLGEFMTYQTGKIETSDVDEYAEQALFEDIKFDQISSGSFQSTTEYVRTGRIFFYREQWNRGIKVQASSPDGHILIGGNVSDQTQLVWSGEDICSNNLAFARGGRSVDFIMPNRSKHVALLLPEDLLETHLKGNDAFKLFLTPQALACNPNLRRYFINRLNQLVSRCLLGDKALSGDTRHKSIEVEVLDLLSQVLVDSQSGVERLSISKRRATLKRATDYADELTMPITVPELAAVASVSTRTLEYLFQENLNLTPVKYLIIKRLQGLHRDLRRSDASATTVAECSTRWGFTQFGRLSVEYRLLFGQSPSTTLRQPYSRAGNTFKDAFQLGIGAQHSG